MRFQNLGGIIGAVLLLVASFVSAYHSLENPTREDRGPLAVPSRWTCRCRIWVGCVRVSTPRVISN